MHTIPPSSDTSAPILLIAHFVIELQIRPKSNTLDTASFVCWNNLMSFFVVSIKQTELNNGQLPTAVEWLQRLFILLRIRAMAGFLFIYHPINAIYIQIYSHTIACMCAIYGWIIPVFFFQPMIWQISYRFCYLFHVQFGYNHYDRMCCCWCLSVCFPNTAIDGVLYWSQLYNSSQW